MRTALLALAGATALTFGLSAIQPGDGDTFAIGTTVPADLALPAIDGKTYTLGDYRARPEDDFAGKVVVIDFWSIQCPWSIKYEEKLIALQKRYAGKDVVFLAIDSNHTEVDADAEDPYARIKAYAKKANVPYPILIDKDNVVADRFDAKTTPHVFVLDRKGVLQYAGGVDDDAKGKKKAQGEPVTEYVADALDAVLAGKKPERATTKPMGCTIKRVRRNAQ